MDLLEGEWNSLLESSASRVPFLRFNYQKIWWLTLGGGEWNQADLNLVAAYQDGKLAGIAPLFFSKNHEGRPALLLIGSIEVSDFLDVIVAPENLPNFMDGLLDFLSSGDLPAWEVLDWCNILEESPTLAVVEAAAKKKGWQFLSERLQCAPHIPLPGNWEDYLAGLDKKQRHEIRRKTRRLEESQLPYKFYSVEDPKELDSEIDAFFNLMVQDGQKANFLTPPMQDFMREVIRNAFDENSLQLAFLEIDGLKSAAYLNFTNQNRTYVYNSGLDRTWTEYSPGWVLLSYLIKNAIQKQVGYFDFMRGDEDYKYRFGGINRFVMRMVVERS